MSGSVGIIARDEARYTMFAVSLTSLKTPVNTGIEWGLSSDRVIGRNATAKRAMEKGAEWILFLDDDHTFPHDLLMRLLAHDVGIVGALYMQRQMPFTPIAYSEKRDDATYTSLNLNDYAPDALVEVAAMGTGGMLIRSEVLHAIQEPWFEYGPTSEDLIFCDRVRELGLGPIYCDLGARMGHFTQAAVWPAHDGEKWDVGFTVADGFNLKVPVASWVEETELADTVSTMP